MDRPERDSAICRVCLENGRVEGLGPRADARSGLAARVGRSASERLLNRGHLERVPRVYVDPYNRERPHGALDLAPPKPDERGEGAPKGEIRRLIHECYRAAA